MPEATVVAKSKVVALSTAETLASSYAVIDTGSATSGVFDVRNNEDVTIEVVYTKGDETTCTMLVEGSLDDTVGAAYTGGVWFPAEPAADVSGSLTAGVFATPAGYRTRTFGTSGTYPVVVNACGFHRLRVKALATGGTLDDGKPGFVDFGAYTGGSTTTRYYDNFQVSTPAAEPAP